LDVVHFPQKDQDRAVAVLEIERASQDFVCHLVLRLNGMEGDSFGCLDPPADLLVTSISLGKAKRVFSGPARRRRKSHDPKSSELSASFLFRFHRFYEVLESRFQVRFVVNQQRMLSDKSRMQRPGFESTTVTAEQQPATDHVDGANNYPRSCWVVSPLSVVRELAPQRTDADEVISAFSGELSQRHPDRFQIVAGLIIQSLLKLSGLTRRLIHDHAPIHDPQ
jgi:hypothetical protein